MAKRVRYSTLGCTYRLTIFSVAMMSVFIIFTSASRAAFANPDLSLFYLHYLDPLVAGSLPLDNQHAPQLKVIGGATEPPPRVIQPTLKVSRTVDSLVGVAGSINGTFSPSWERHNQLMILPTWLEPCLRGGLGWFTRSLVANQVLASGYEDYWYGGECTTSPIGAYKGDGVPTITNLVTTTTYRILAPIRRTAIDGGKYDASPMVVRRNEAAWYTHFWGYRMGLVANESDFNEADRVKFVSNWPFFPSPRNNFELATLPPPWIEDDVLEYVNKQDFPKQPSGQFFYAVTTADKTALDAVPAWQRTGKSFKSGGYVSACRFYGGKNGGPNTHFYSADDKECEALKKLTFLSYEGQTFAVNMPMPATASVTPNASAVTTTTTCPTASKPLYRLYNNAGASNGAFVSNHRYVTERSDVAAAVAQGWLDEGTVMCVPE